MYTTQPIILSTSGAVAGGALSAGASLYSGSVQEQMTSDAFTVAARQLSSLTERDQIREAVFLDALQQTANDPNKTDNPTTAEIEGRCHWPTPTDSEANEVVPGDPNDADGDGIKNERISCFEYWWDRRIKQIRDGFPSVRSDVEAFLNGPFSAFEAQAEATYLCQDVSRGERCGDQICDPDEQCGWASICEQDCGICPVMEGGSGDGGEE